MLKPFSAILIFAIVACNAGKEPEPTFSVHIKTEAPGYSDSFIKEQITDRLERELRDMKDLKSIESISKSGTSIVMLTFPSGLDQMQTKYDVKDKVLLSDHYFPQGLQATSQIYVLDESYWPRLNLRLTSKNQKDPDFEACVKELQQEILYKREIYNVTAPNLPRHYLLIEADPKKLREKDLLVQELAWRLQVDNDQGQYGVSSSVHMICGGNRIRLEADYFDPSIEDRVFFHSSDEGMTTYFLKDVASVSYIGEISPPSSIDLQISVNKEFSVDEVKKLIPEVIEQTNRTCTYQYELTELALPADPYDFSGIYPELEKGDHVKDGCHFVIDHQACQAAGGISFSHDQVSIKLRNILLLYPELSPSEVLEFTVTGRGNDGTIIEKKLCDFVSLECED